jgi:pimeloyl-ACP methyl ester carboxylesterase
MFEEAFRQGDEGWVEDWLATYDDWGFRLADVPRPVAVWRGDADRLSSATDSRLLAAGIGAASLQVVPGEGHAIAVTHWPEILDSVLTPASASPS